MYLVHRLPAWARRPGREAAARPKVHLVDSGIAARLLRLAPERLARRDPAALTAFGHVLESFVVGEVLREASLDDRVVAVGHWRSRDREVDLVVERDDGSVVGVGVKASGRVVAADADGLRRLRELSGDAFAGGAVLHLGGPSFRLDGGLVALPVAALWR